MYELFQHSARRQTGVLTFVELAYLRRTYARNISDVRQYYRDHPKQVSSQNLLGNLLVHLPRRWELDDRRYYDFVDDNCDGITRAMGMTSASYRGKAFESGVTLGPECTEMVLVHSASRLPELTESAGRYLYHTRTDLGLPIMNNTTPGTGYGVLSLNPALMAVQYRHWLKREQQKEQPESVYRFIGSVVLPGLITSYLDVAFFNRLERLDRGIGHRRYPTPHPFYLSDYTRQIDRLIGKINDLVAHRSGDAEQLLGHVPCLHADSLQEVVKLPNGPVTRANEWVLLLARLPYLRYVVNKLDPQRTDQRHLNEIYNALREARYDNAFSGVGSAQLVGKYRAQIVDLIETMENKR